MRILPASAFVCCLALAAGCQRKVEAPPPPPIVVAQIHFVGSGQLAGNTNALKLKSLWAMPTTIALREQTLGRLAGAAEAWLRSTPDAAPATNAPALVTNAVTNAVAGASNAVPAAISPVRPLLDDLLSAESFVAARRQTNGAEDLTLAVRLPLERAAMWRSNLLALLAPGATNQTNSTVTELADGWQIKRAKAPESWRLAVAGDWVLLGCGHDQLPTFDAALQRAKTNAPPFEATGDSWLDGELEWPRVMRDVPPLAGWPVTRGHFSLRGKGENLRFEARFEPTPDSLGALDDWKIPASLIREDTARDQIISFTAARGLAPWLGRNFWFKPSDGLAAPNELFVWAQTHVPYQTRIAFPVASATGTVAQIAARFGSGGVTNVPLLSRAQLEIQTNNMVMAWTGLPIIVPYLSAKTVPEGEFILGGLFPVDVSSNAPPADLFAQVTGRTNLVYYDWEITQNRVLQWYTLFQLGSIIGAVPQTGGYSAAQRWVAAVAPKLGNTVTEITATGTNQLSLLRVSHTGFTGIELATLAYWLDDPAFPAFHLAEEPPGPRLPRMRAPAKAPPKP